MYNLIETVIRAGGYKLSEIQHKTKKLYILGDITEEQLDTLLALAAEGVNPDAERPETLAIIKGLADRIDSLEARLKALEGGGTDEPADPDTPAEYEAWTPWDGVSDKYQPGTIVQHGGKLWQSVYTGQNVWEPGTTGTAALWTEYTA